MTIQDRFVTINGKQYEISVVGGVPPPPGDVPAPGKFSTFTLNTPADASPSLFDTTLSEWSGGAFIDDFGSAGGIAYRGGGHTGIAAEYGGVLVLDLATRSYVARNIPALAPQNRLVDARDVYGAFAANGAPTREHTYNSLQQMPTAWGGGPDGSLVQVGLTGGHGSVSGFGCTYKFDLSQTVDGHQRITEGPVYDFGNGQLEGVTDTLGTAIDWTRQGWWTKCSLYANGGGKLIFTSKDGTVTPWASPINSKERCSLHHFSDDDILVWFTSFGASNPMVRICHPGDADWSVPSVSGTPPPPYTAAGDSSMSYMGMKWFTLINAFVGLNIVDSIIDPTHVKVWKLIPPQPGQRFTGTWTWATEIVESADGSTFEQGDDAFMNGAYGRLLEWPAMRCAVWTRDWNKTGLLVRLAGM